MQAWADMSRRGKVWVSDSEQCGREGWTQSSVLWAGAPMWSLHTALPCPEGQNVFQGSRWYGLLNRMSEPERVFQGTRWLYQLYL